MYKIMEITPIDSFSMIMLILLIALTSWLPLFIFKIVKKYIDPSDYEKLLDSTKRNIINNKVID